jgi:hypothetical protein
MDESLSQLTFELLVLRHLRPKAQVVSSKELGTRLRKFLRDLHPKMTIRKPGIAEDLRSGPKA